MIYPYELAVGQALLIRNGQGERTMEIASNGYAYPFISRWVLNYTLPFLSELSVFSYGFTEEGVLVPPILDEIAQTPFFKYELDGITYEVWFEDVRSLQKKLADNAIVIDFLLYNLHIFAIMLVYLKKHLNNMLGCNKIFL